MKKPGIKALILISTFVILIGILTWDKSGIFNTIIGNKSYNFLPSPKKLEEYIIDNGYLSEVDKILYTPDYQKPVYNAIFGRDKSREQKVVVVFVEKKGSPIKIIDIIDYNEFFTKEDVYKSLKDKGIDISNSKHLIHITPYPKYTLVWNVEWEEYDSKEERNTYYRYKFDVESGKIVEEYKY